ncbi:MAG: polyphosphate kinase 2 family protein [Nitriliruptorales bacterium]|nr:polyphosphate kinase 2 family protein [Nitriliruptorales bacterium]
MTAEFIESLRVAPGKNAELDARDPANRLGYDEEDEAANRVGELVEELARLQYRLEAENERAVLLVLQGMPTSGKDETLREALRGLNPQAYRVEHFSATSEPEGQHDYLWRFHRSVPQLGEIGVFNRSHYESVLSERMYGEVDDAQARRRFQHLCDFERMLADEDISVVKVFLHLSKEEQAARLRERLEDPEKRWEFDADDLDDRKIWDEYMAAFEECLRETSTDYAPWYVVPADVPIVRNLAVLEILRRALEEMDPQIPRDLYDDEQIQDWLDQLDADEASSAAAGDEVSG